MAEFMSDLPFKLLGPHEIEIEGKRHRFYVLHKRDSSTVWLDGRTYYIPRENKKESKSGSHPDRAKSRLSCPASSFDSRLQSEIGHRKTTRRRHGVDEDGERVIRTESRSSRGDPMRTRTDPRNGSES